MTKPTYDFGRKTDAERSMQTLLLQHLKLQGYEILKSNQKLEYYENTVFRSEVERINNLKLSDSEFKRLLTALHVNMSTAFDYLRSGLSLTLDNGDTHSIHLYDSRNWNRNTFQVVEELTVPGVIERRLDVTILMNGLPVVTGELKKTSGLGVEKALADVNAYTKEGTYRTGLLRYIQVYFISDGVNTKYFSTDLPAEAGQPYINTFYWSDVENARVKRLMDNGKEEGWTSSFFKLENIFDLIKYYTLKTSGRDQRILVLRPYQIHALESGLNRVFDWENGFYWHATGSGKTLTSYMLGLAIQKQGVAKKVIMILDRVDLADQTIKEFEKFGGSAGEVSRGRKLSERIADPSDIFIMTTIQSLSRLLKNERKRKKVNSALGEKTVIIVDECHRSTFGTMFQSVKRSFSDLVLLGFTGTPILPENQTADNRVTSDLFGEPIHIYTTKEAIDDGNVLRFNEKVVNPKYSKSFSDLTAEELNIRETEIVDFVAKNFWKHTQQKNLEPSTVGGKERVKNPDYNGGLTGLITVPRISEAISFFNKIKSRMNEQNRTTAVVFSMATDEKDYEEGKSQLTDIFEHYDSQFSTNFAVTYRKDAREAVDTYASDVATRVKTGEIDLVVVANMFLTGFDSPNLGVIYIDRLLKRHSLMQAVSRVNRIHPSKKHKQSGIAIFFSDRGDVKAEFDDTLRIFSNGRSIEGVVDRKSFLELRNEISNKVIELRGIHNSPSSIDSIQSVEELREAGSLVSAIRAGSLRLSTYDEWENNPEDWKHLGISEAELDEYYSELREAGRRVKITAPPEDLETLEDFEIEIAKSKEYLIDVAYINELLKNAIFAPPRDRKKWIIKVRRELSISDDPDVLKNMEALVETVEKIENGDSNINSNEELFMNYEIAKERIRQRRFNKAVDTLDCTPEQLTWILKLYSSKGVLPQKEIDGLLKNKGYSILERRELRAEFGKMIEFIDPR